MSCGSNTIPAAILMVTAIIAGPLGGVAHAANLVAFGDSTTAARETVPKVYAQILQEQLPDRLGQRVTVYNAGIGGNTTYDALQRIDKDVRARHPDTVVVQFGINDSWVYDGGQGGPSAVPIDQATQVEHPNASRGNYVDNISKIVSTLKNDGARVILMTPNQLQTAGAGAEMAWRNDLLGDYAKVVRTVAAAERVELLDVWQIYSDYAAKPDHSVNDLLVDSQHPGQAGHQMVAARLLAMIAPEPSAMVFLATAGLGLLAHLWRRRTR